MYETLEIARDGGVATLWMNRPDVHNAFNEQLIAELTAACRAGRRRHGARGGAGRARQELLGRRRPQLDEARRRCLVEENLADARKLAGMLRTLAEMNKPTIARVHGAALGGGMGLASACDICVAGEGRCSPPPRSVRHHPVGHQPLRDPRHRRPPGHRYFQTAERISAPGRELGLAHEAVPADGLDAKVQEIVTALLQGGPRPRPPPRI
jgi:methylglutaconyl-CoA hydratase